ncbi:MAG: hypothetical protein AB7P33_03475 [Dehalococcoidia bacterium]
MPSRHLVTPGWPLARSLALLVSFVLIAGSFAFAAGLVSALDVHPAPDRYNFAAWEARNLPAKWIYEFGEIFRHDRSVDEQNADIIRFFDLTNQINRLEQQVPADDPQLHALYRERDRLENRVEDTIEDRIGTVLKDLGITRSLPLLGSVVWPPVDFEFTESPRSLATSPRDKIELLGTELLRDNLTLEQVEAIEEQTEREKGVSALAAPTSGIGAYPSIVDHLSSYRSALDVVAHEWTHNYLFFRPLGFNYYASNDLRTMNETTADLVGSEVSAEVLRRWPLPAPPAPDSAAAPAPAPAQQPAVDVGAELRALRGEVDALLAAGKVDEAEALMDAKRDDLQARGVYIRKINQAYFAFTNLYAGEAGSPGATNPIGPKVDQLRQKQESLAAFVRVMGSITSVEELDAALAR